MAITLFFLSLVKQNFKRLLKIYTTLFTVFSILLVIISAHQYHAKWWPVVAGWLTEEPEVQHVSASTSGLQSTDLEQIIPMIEQFKLKNEVTLHAPKLSQYPELPRGCEVTSLAMLLNYFEFDTTKLKLAEQVAKDTTPFKQEKNKTTFGNPHIGFVGSMYSLSKHGYGVYHEPIAELAKKYAGERVVDFSGGSFYEILESLNDNQPVWVIINTHYKKLPSHFFQKWETSSGPIWITLKEHSVLVTGYDDNYIYFNDPLAGITKKAPIREFHDAWVQMGKQAITIKPS